jgi:hypothetical protein
MAEDNQVIDWWERGTARHRGNGGSALRTDPVVTISTLDPIATTPPPNPPRRLAQLE